MGTRPAIASVRLRLRLRLWLRLRLTVLYHVMGYLKIRSRDLRDGTSKEKALKKWEGSILWERRRTYHICHGNRQ
jgi:hypothetical protein